MSGVFWIAEEDREERKEESKKSQWNFNKKFKFLSIISFVPREKKHYRQRPLKPIPIPVPTFISLILLLLI